MPGLKKIKLWTLLVLAVGFGCYVGVLAPLNIQLTTDTIYSDWMWLGKLCGYALEIIDIAVFLWVYAATAYIWYRGRWKAAAGLSGIYVGLVFFKYIGNYVIGFLNENITWPTWSDLSSGFDIGMLFRYTTWPTGNVLVVDLLLIGMEVGLELVQYAAVTLCAVLVFGVYGTKFNGTRELFPFTNWLNLKNPVLQWSTLAAGVMVMFRWGIYLYFWIGSYGFPQQPAEWVVIVGELLSDVLIGVIVYFVMVLLMQLFDRMNTRRAK